MAITEYGPISWERMIEARKAVQRRSEYATASLAGGFNIPYAVIGGNAVAAWVSTVAREAVRGTPNVDLLIDRKNLGFAMTAMQNAGFVQAFHLTPHSFLDSPTCRLKSRIRFFFAGERITDRCTSPLPQVGETVRIGNVEVVSLRSLVTMKLASFRTVDRVHLRDMLDVELIDQSWKLSLSEELASRLQQLLDDPDG